MTHGIVKIYDTKWMDTTEYKVDSYGGNVIIATRHIHNKKDKSVLEAGEQRANIMHNDQTYYSINSTFENYKYSYEKYAKTHIPSICEYNSGLDYLEGTSVDDFIEESLYDDHQKYNGSEELIFNGKASQIFDQIVKYTETLTKKATDNAVLAMNDLSNLLARFKAGKTGIDGITDVKGDGNSGIYTVTYIDEDNKEQILSFDFTTSNEVKAGKEPEFRDFENIGNKGRCDASDIRSSRAEACEKKNSK